MRTADTLTRQLTTRDGIPLAVGSILGSGVLFLPSLTFVASGEGTAYVWLLTTLLTIPLLCIFTDMVKVVPNESGIEGFVTLGLGRNVGATIPVLLLGTVCLGMPAAAVIVGEYARAWLGGPRTTIFVVAAGIVVLGALTNLRGIRQGTIVQSVATALLILIASLLIAFTMRPAAPRYGELIGPLVVTDVLPGVVLAFWAFAGLENLTFMAGEFREPERDFRRSAILAVAICGVLYLLLSINIAALIPRDRVNPLVGLYQLSEYVPAEVPVEFLLVLFSFLCVQLNFNSWIWGISRLVYSSARQKKLPPWFARLDENGIPNRAIWLLAGLFCVSLVAWAVAPTLLRPSLVAVSTNFVFIYVLCLLSYLRYFDCGWRWWLALASAFVLTLTLLTSKWVLVYPLALAFASWISPRWPRMRERAH